MRPIRSILLAPMLLLAAPAVAMAAAEPAGLDKGDTAWMLMASALVLLMTPGLAFFYGGLVRRKNILSVLMQCFACMCLMSLLWVFVGYSLAFSDEQMLGGFVGNFKHLFLGGVGYGPGKLDTVPDLLFMVFQGMFAIITPALILGAFAERMKFAGFCVFMSLWLLLVYCPVCHWVWGGATGFWNLGAGGLGAIDFAGGTVVHINAGIAALVAAVVLGKRHGYPERIPRPHNLPFAVLGAGLLWFGWFGFNAGSAGAANGSAVNAFVVTHVATAAAGLTWMVLDRIFSGKATVLGVITGAVAGLVAITPASGSVSPMGAAGVGLGAGLVCYVFVALVKPKAGYDDSLDVFGVHGMGGIWGAIAAGLWATDMVTGNETNGLFYGNAAQVGIQIKAVVYTLIWSGVVSLILLKIVDMVVGIKVTEHEQRVGLDLTEHAEAAYTVVE